MASHQGQSGQNGLEFDDAGPELGVLLGVLGRWSDGRGPLYRRLAAALSAAARRGELAPGMRLPAERTLARALSLSRSTVVAAYELLRQEEVVDRRQGSGTRVRALADGPRAEPPAAGGGAFLGRNTLFGRLTDGTDGTIDFHGAYLLGGGLPRVVLADLDRELAGLSRASGYTPLGHPPLRQAVAERLTRRGLPTRPAQVLITSGAQQAIGLAAANELRPGDAALVENPTYPGALDAIGAAGARLAWVTTGRGGADVEQLREVVARARPRLVYLIPTFQNPTGGLMPEARRRALARLVRELGVPLVEDDSLADLTLDDPPPPPIAAFDPEAPILTLGSLSKLGWGGLRVGWVRAPEPLVARLGRLKAVTDLGSSLPSQVIATRLLGHVDELLRDRQRMLRERYALITRLLQEWLPDWSWEPPRGGVCLWVRLPHGSAAEFAQVALRHGLSLVPGPVSSADNGFADYLRLPFGLEPPALEEGVRRLARAWDAYVPLAEARRETLTVIV
jgi:DNA-binding transcriptional MocR family regulator